MIRARPQAAGNPGNRSLAMPSRQTAFVQMSLPEAVEEILRGRAMAWPDIARALFEITSPDDVARARKTLLSTLSRGAKEGRWRMRGGRSGVYIGQPPLVFGHINADLEMESTE